MTGISENTTPPYDDAPRTIGIIKTAAKNLQRSLSLSKQAEQFRKWAEKNAARLNARAFPLDKQRWTDFANRPVSYVTNEPDLPRLAWHWFFEVHRHAIEETWLTAPRASPEIRNALIPTLHAHLSPKEASPNLARLHDLAGHYAVYRPSFIHTEDIMVMAMECGIDGDISRFGIVMHFTNDDGEERTEHVDGFALPYQDSILFQGWLREAASPFIFVLSHFPVDTKTGKISKGDGTLLVGAGGSLSSAFPITMRRASKLVHPETLEVEAFKKTVTAHKAILKFIGRGVLMG